MSDEQIDVEGMNIGISEAIGKATAAIALQTATTAILVKNGHMTLDDAATISAMALAGLSIYRLQPGDQEMAEAVLRGYTKAVVAQLSTH